MSPPRRLRAVPASPGVRTVLYRRVSAVMGRSGEDFLSPDLQSAAMRDLIRRRGLLEVEVIDDIDVSGRTFERAGIRRVLDMARAREIDVVAVYDLARFGRNTAESLRNIAELRDLGVSVVSTVEQIDDSPEGQFQLSVFLSLAQLQSDQIGRRWQQLIAYRAEQGRLHVSRPAAGYVRVGREIEPDPVLGPLVTEMFARYARGDGIFTIAQWWSQAVGRATSYTSLKRMLRNPIYVGKVRLHGQVFPGRHEPLVSDAVWRRVQARIERDASTPSRTLAYANPFARLIVCDACDRALHMHASGHGGWYLQCPGKTRYRICAGVGAPALAKVEAAVLDRIEEEVGQLQVNVGAAVAARRARSAAAKVDARRLRREIADLERAIARANADRLRRRLPESEVEAAVGLLRAELEPLRVALRSAEDVAGTPAPAAMVRLAAGLRGRWPRMTAEEKNRALRALVVQVRVVRGDGRRSQPMGERVEVILR
jgi:site-specific DNA recombinase